MNEIWREIRGFEGLYRVSNLGRVMGYPRITRSGYYIAPRIIKGSLYTSGYIVVKLRCGDKLKRFAVHRLVAEAFVQNPGRYPIINHKDEDKTNNRADNLEWCTHQYNSTYGTAIERKRESYIKKHSKAVRQYSLSGEFLKEYRSTTEAARASGACVSEISSCCKRRENAVSANGFQWRYANECPEGNISAYSIKPSPLMQPISQYTTDGKLIKHYRSIEDAVRETGTRHSSIYACCVGTYKTANGYIWRYKS